MTVRGTSHAAKRAIKPFSPKQRTRVFLFVLGKGEYGATLHEICVGLSMDASSASPRRGELEKAGFLEDSGRCRPTPSGVKAHVWVVPKDVAARSKAMLAIKGITL